MPVLQAAGYNVPQAPSVAPAADAGTPYQSSASATPDAFGGRSAAAMSRFGDQLDQASNHLLAITERYNEVTADDQSNKAQDQINKIFYGDPDNPNDTGFNGLRGEDAMRAFPDVRKQIGQTLQDYRSKLTTAAQQQRFDAQARQYRNIMLSKVGAHYDQQFHQYQADEAKANASLNIGKVAGAASDGDQASFEQFVGKSLDDARDRGSRMGMPPATIELEQQGVRQHAIKSWAEGLVARGDAIGADAFVERNRAAAGDLYEPLKRQFHAEAEKQQAYNDVFGPPAGGPTMVRGGATQTAVGDAGDQVAATLRQRGWSDAAIAGALNNAMTESSLNPKAKGAAGEVGLFQFHPKSHIGPFTQAYGGDWSPAAQANYVADVVERSIPGYGQSTNPQAATSAFLHGFEKPKDQSDRQLNARFANNGASQAILQRVGYTRPAPAAGAGAPDTVTTPAPPPPPDASDRPDNTVPGLQNLLTTIDQRAHDEGWTADRYERAYSLARTRLNAAYTDEQRQRQEQQRISKDIVNDAENEVIADHWSGAPKMTAQQISVDHRFDTDPAARQRMLALIKPDRTDADPVTSANTMHDLMRQISSGDITDRAPILDAFNSQPPLLNEKHFNFLMKQVEDVRTPEGLKIAKDIDKLVAAVKPSITKSNPLQGSMDASGDLQLGAFEEEVRNTVELMRKGGAKPREIADYLSVKRYRDNPELLVPYQTSVQESAANMARALSRTPPPPPPGAQPAAPTMAPNPFQGGQEFTAPIPPLSATSPVALPPVPTTAITPSSAVPPRQPGESVQDYYKRRAAGSAK